MEFCPGLWKERILLLWKGSGPRRDTEPCAVGKEGDGEYDVVFVTIVQVVIRQVALVLLDLDF